MTEIQDRFCWKFPGHPNIAILSLSGYPWTKLGQVHIKGLLQGKDFLAPVVSHGCNKHGFRSLTFDKEGLSICKKSEVPWERVKEEVYESLSGLLEEGKFERRKAYEFEIEDPKASGKLVATLILHEKGLFQPSLEIATVDYNLEAEKQWSCVSWNRVRGNKFEDVFEFGGFLLVSWSNMGYLCPVSDNIIINHAGFVESYPEKGKLKLKVTFQDEECYVLFNK